MIRNWKTISDDTNTMFTSRRDHTATSYENKYRDMSDVLASPSSESSSDNDNTQAIDNDYSEKSGEIADQMREQRDSMSYSKPDVVLLRNIETKFVDKDNYNKYLHIKNTFNFASILFFQMFWKIYGFLIIGFAIYELVKVFYEDVLNIDTKWGLLLMPYVLYILYNSFNTYSFIKISF